MKINAQSLLKVLSLCALTIFSVSCSKDSDLLSDYVLADTLDARNLETALLDDTYQVSLTGSMILDVLANDTFGNDAAVVITETSAPTNGTLVINTGETLTYTPNPEIIEQVVDTTSTSTPEVVDTFTYTAEVVNEEGTATSEVASVVITTGDNSSRANNVANISPFDYCQDGNPIGGGVGYDAILTTGTHVVSTDLSWPAFKMLVEAREKGDVVFLKSGVTISLNSTSGRDIIAVPEGVTIASDRGINEGALIQRTESENNSYRGMFTTNGTDIRITGLRFKGPNTGYDATELIGEVDRSYAVSNRGFENFEVDNCEFSYFSYGSIIVNYITGSSAYPYKGSTQNNKIHHNYIHDNAKRWLGYGVQIHTGRINVYGNLFANNGHDLTGTTNGYASYEHYCNTHQGDGFVHNVDMHGDNEVNGRFGYAGTRMHIHHNDFEDLMDHPAYLNGSSDLTNIRFRGTPKDSIIVEFNRFALSAADKPIGQYFWIPGTLGRLKSENNIYANRD